MVNGWPPRWLTKPKTKKTDGTDIAEFIETYCRVTKDSIGGQAGELISLRPWQRNLINAIFVTDKDSNYLHRIAIVGLPRKSGKALALDTEILTDSGWKTMGTLTPDDLVHAPDGTLTKILWCSELNHRPCYKVKFSDGAEIVANDEHEWTVTDNKYRANDNKNFVRVLTTQELYETQKFGFRQDRRYSIAVPAPLERPEVDLPIDPYILGLWLGDGANASGRITNLDKPIWDSIEDAGYKLGNDCHKGDCRTHTLLGLKVILDSLGLINNKHIPDLFMFASEKQRGALLAGLLDSDGYAGNGTGSPRIEYCSTHKRLADDTLLLIRSLGYKATIKESRAKLYGKDCGPRFRIGFTAYRESSPFRLERKSARLAPTPARLTRAKSNAIVSIEKTETVPTRCIAVEHPTKQYLAGRSLTPTHNSALGSAIALYGLLLGPHGGEIYSCAGDRDQARIVFETAKRMVQLDPELSEHVKIYRDSMEVPTTGSRYRVLSADASSAEGLNPTLTIFDELHVQPNARLWDTMTLGSGARKNALTLAITTAGVKGDRYGNDTICYQLYQHGQKVVNKEVEDPTFFFSWHEPKKEDADWKDPKTWKEANPGFGDLSLAGDFESVITRTSEAEFRTKRLNQWVTSKESAFEQGVWETCGQPGRIISPKEEIILGFDGSYSGDSTALIGCTTTDPHIFVIELWEKPMDDPNWRVPAMDVEKKIVDICKQYTVKEIACDPYRWQRTMSFLDDEGYPVVEWNTAAIARIGPAWQKFYDAVIDQELTHDNNPALNRHIANLVLKRDNRGVRPTKETGTSPRKIDAAISAIIAFDRASQIKSDSNILESIY